jgi:hypothetical protein
MRWSDSTAIIFQTARVTLVVTETTVPCDWFNPPRAYERPVLAKSPKNWRWFDVFRVVAAQAFWSVCEIAQVARRRRAQQLINRSRSAAKSASASRNN